MYSEALAAGLEEKCKTASEHRNQTAAQTNRSTGWSGNKAGYTATSVACGWAGAVIESPEHLGKSGEAKDRKNIKK